MTTPPAPRSPASHAAPASGAVGGVVMIALTLASWTSIPLFLKDFTGEIDGWTANGWRYGFSALMWLPVLVLGAARRNLPPGLWRASLLPSVFNTAAQACFGLAPYYMSPGLMTFSLRFQIVFVTVGAALMFPAERRVIRSPGFLVGMACVIGGTIATVAFQPGGLGGGTGVGVALAVAAGILYAAYALAVRRLMHGLSPLTAFAAVSQVTAAGMVGLMLVYGGEAGAGALDMSRARIGMLLVSAVIGIGIGHTLYFASIARLGLAVSAGVVQLQPVTVSIASIFIFGERLSGLQWATGLLAVAGAGVMLRAQHRLARSRPDAPSPADEFDELPVDGAVALVAQANDPPAR